MSRSIDFTKIEATGNDFIFIDKKKNDIKELSADNIRVMCNRRTGIGADGIVLILSGEIKPLKMKYFNADGSLGEMCGNALRATVLFGYLLGKIKMNSWQLVEADDGEHHVIMDSAEQIQVEIKVKNTLKDVPEKDLNLTNDLETLGFINTGVPHLVLKTESDLSDLDVLSLGRDLRYHRLFHPEGTNVNFIKVIGNDQLQVRTYERGVENETLSCGTGIIASALAYWQKFGLASSVTEISTLGGKLSVFYQDDRLFLKGPARVAFVGQYL